MQKQSIESFLRTHIWEGDAVGLGMGVPSMVREWAEDTHWVIGEEDMAMGLNRDMGHLR